MNRRRFERQKAVLPVKMFGKGVGDTSYCDMVHTLDVGRGGARLASVRRQIQVGCSVVVQYQYRKAEFRVVWVKSLNAQKDQWIGLQSVAEAVVPWRVYHPTSLLSQLGSTPDRECHMQADGKEASSPRPRRIRTRMKTTGCVCQPGSEDVVSVVNMSREGLCFQSTREYVPETLIRIAAPYTPTVGCNIFMIARIAWVQTTATAIKEYGVEYVKSYSNDEAHEGAWPRTITTTSAISGATQAA